MKKKETKKVNTVALIIVLFLVLLFGVGQFFARAPIANTNPSAGNTRAAITDEIVTYFPPAPASSTPVLKGSCWVSSIAEPYRADAWRCTTGDPCFQIGDSTNTLLCRMNPADPAATSSIVLSLTKPLPMPDVISSSSSENWGWLVKLQDGTLCSPFTGTLPFAADGEVAEYSCAPQSPGGPAWDIFGDINASSSIWTAKLGMLLRRLQCSRRRCSLHPSFP